MVDKIRESIKGDNIEFRVADIENLDFDDNSFDIVMAHHVIYHASNKDKALKELKRVVKNDGMVTVTTNSDSHMLNVYAIGRELDDNFPTDRIIDSFAEEIADTMLGDYFSSVNNPVCWKVII
jgi:ubiquinone/menaquinone biosynthesis C-methylase UbiE